MLIGFKFMDHVMATLQTPVGGAGFEIERSGFELVLVPSAFVSFGHMIGKTTRNDILKRVWGLEPW